MVNFVVNAVTGDDDWTVMVNSVVNAVTGDGMIAGSEYRHW